MDKCPICKQECEDIRHIMVECFYDVAEVVPEMVQNNDVYLRVFGDSTYLGKLVKFKNGLLRKFKKNRVDDNKVEWLDDWQKIGEHKFINIPAYTIGCCKPCRAKFLHLLKAFVGE